MEPQGERIRALEVQIGSLVKLLEDHIKNDETAQSAMNAKLDQLLGLKNRGMGAFWLASGFFGILLATVGSNIGNWIWGVIHGS